MKENIPADKLLGLIKSLHIVKKPTGSAGPAGMLASADEDQGPQAQQSPGDEAARKLLVANPTISASTFYNLLKSEGLEIVSKEADSSSANPSAVRAQEKAGPGIPEDKYDSCVDQVKDKGGADNAYAICNAQLAKKYGEAVLRGQKKKESKNVEREPGPSFGNLNFQTARFLESSQRDNAIGPTRFKVVLLQEGLGNFKDAYYYSRAALESAIPVFEGKKIYADHPSAVEEQTRPERSVKDVLGHFENVYVMEADDGASQLCADVVILPEEPFRWARALMNHSVEYAKKYPDKDFVGLSINASGDADSVALEKLAENDLPKSSVLKLQKAREQGIQHVKYVSIINEAVSCDLVTEAGAGGKVLEMIEKQAEGSTGKPTARKRKKTSLKKAMTKAQDKPKKESTFIQNLAQRFLESKRKGIKDENKSQRS